MLDATSQQKLTAKTKHCDMNIHPKTTPVGEKGSLLSRLSDATLIRDLQWYFSLQDVAVMVVVLESRTTAGLQSIQQFTADWTEEPY